MTSGLVPRLHYYVEHYKPFGVENLLVPEDKYTSPMDESTA